MESINTGKVSDESLGKQQEKTSSSALTSCQELHLRIEESNILDEDLQIRKEGVDSASSQTAEESQMKNCRNFRIMVEDRSRFIEEKNQEIEELKGLLKQANKSQVKISEDNEDSNLLKNEIQNTMEERRQDQLKLKKLAEDLESLQKALRETEDSNRKRGREERVERGQLLKENTTLLAERNLFARRNELIKHEFMDLIDQRDTLSVEKKNLITKLNRFAKKNETLTRDYFVMQERVSTLLDKVTEKEVRETPFSETNEDRSILRKVTDFITVFCSATWELLDMVVEDTFKGQ